MPRILTAYTVIIEYINSESSVFVFDNEPEARDCFENCKMQYSYGLFLYGNSSSFSVDSWGTNKVTTRGQ